MYRPPNDDSENISAFLQTKSSKKDFQKKKKSFVLGNFNMSCLKRYKNTKTKHFYDNVFQIGAIPIINCLSQILEHSASLIDNILTTEIFNISLKKSITQRCLLSFSNIFLNQLVKEKFWEYIKIKKKKLISVT